MVFFIQNQRIFVHTAFHFISLDRFVELSTSFSFQPTFYYYFVPVFAICFLSKKFILLFKYLFVFSFIGVIFKSEYKKKKTKQIMMNIPQLARLLLLLQEIIFNKSKIFFEIEEKKGSPSFSCMNHKFAQLHSFIYSITEFTI